MGRSKYKNVFGVIDAAAAPAKLLQVGVQKECLLGAVGISSAQRGLITRFNVGGIDVNGGNGGIPISALQFDSQTWECNFCGLPVPTGNNQFDLAATLDAAGQMSARCFVDPIPAQVRQRMAQGEEYPSDPNWFIGMGQVAVAAGAVGTALATTVKRRVKGLYRLVVDIAGAPAINDIQITSVNIGGDETINAVGVPMSGLDFLANRTSKLGGLFEVELDGGQPLQLLLNNTSAAPINVSACFMRYAPLQGALGTGKPQAA